MQQNETRINQTINPEINSKINNPKYNFQSVLADNKLSLRPTSAETFQANITYFCNQACTHCHVDASPNRTEFMARETIDKILQIMGDDERIKNLDITGGAPELHPDFDYFVTEAKKLGKHVMVRHNLTVTIDGNPQTKESKEYLPEFYAEQKVELISSLPYYQEFFTDKQRGRKVFEKSIRSMKMLNRVGYGRNGLALNLVYNPVGLFLPAAQESLEKDYKIELKKKFDVDFNSLFTITNMPIERFKKQLERLGKLDDYYTKLINAFNPSAAENIMCRSMVSIDHEGGLYDCDFNQMLDMPVTNGQPMSVHNFDYDAFVGRDILFASHCFGCTAGAGSSCGGETA